MGKKIYKQSELAEGICFYCGEYTDKIVKKDGRCINCIEEEERQNEMNKN